MPKCPKCGHKWEDKKPIDSERKLTVIKVPEGKAIGCLYCLDCERFGWGNNKCYWCGSKNVRLYSKKCGVVEYVKAHPDGSLLSRRVNAFQ